MNSIAEQDRIHVNIMRQSPSDAFQIRLSVGFTEDRDWSFVTEWSAGGYIPA